MRNIKLTISFDGTKYAGWQSQKNALSIQDVIQRVLKDIVGEKVTLIGSSRTDAGVHARAFVANFKTRSTLACEKLKKALNTRLPKDIVITDCSHVTSSFNAQHDAKKKLYRYTVMNCEIHDPLLRHYAWRYSYSLNLRAMKSSASALIGKHDFKTFQNTGGDEKKTVRTIHKLTVAKKKDLVYIDVEADGFLYNMVRNIVGTLLEIGRGKLPADSMRSILAKKDRRSAGPTVPAQGLCLIKITY